MLQRLGWLLLLQLLLLLLRMLLLQLARDVGVGGRFPDRLRDPHCRYRGQRLYAGLLDVVDRAVPVVVNNKLRPVHAAGVEDGLTWHPACQGIDEDCHCRCMQPATVHSFFKVKRM